MRALILADEFFASRERGLLTRLEIGLADEGVRVIHAVPAGTATHEPEGVFSRAITYSSKTLMLTRPLAVRKLARDLAAMEDAEDSAAIDIVHVFGGSVWTLGADLAREINAGLALEVWRAGLVARARGFESSPDTQPLFLAPDPAIERALTASDAGSTPPPARLAAWGVLTPDAPRAVLDDGQATSVMLVGSGRDAGAFRAAIEGLAPVVKQRPDTLVFCDALAARRCDIWSLARTLNILPNLTLIEELESRRDLLVHGDLLLLPEAHGEQRSIVLDAMAGGMVVVAAEDPFVTVLQDNVTARTVARPHAGEWSRVLLEVTGSTAESRRLARSAHQHIRTHRRASDHVRAVLGAYDWLVSDEPLPFKP